MHKRIAAIIVLALAFPAVAEDWPQWRGPRRNGKRAVAVVTVNPDRHSSVVVGVEAQTGKELWRYGPWNEKWGAICADLLIDGHVYGVHYQGALKCLDWNTGQVKWPQRDFGRHGTLVAADGKLLVQNSKSGELHIVEATPAGYKELRRAEVFKEGGAETFTVPVLSNGRIYCRSYEGQVVCLSADGVTK